MGVYINKAELLKELSVIQDRPIRSAMQIIKILPTIDLVRCGECKKWREDDGDMICGISELICNADDFCSHGERRADCEDETDEEWYDWRDEQEYEDRWERRADERIHL